MSSLRKTISGGGITKSSIIIKPIIKEITNLTVIEKISIKLDELHYYSNVKKPLITEIKSKLDYYYDILNSISSTEEDFLNYYNKSNDFSFILLICFLFEKTSILQSFYKNDIIIELTKTEGQKQCNNLALCHLLNKKIFWDFFDSIRSKKTISNENSIILISDTFRGLFLLNIYKSFLVEMINRNLEFEPKRTFNHSKFLSFDQGKELQKYLLNNNFVKTEKQKEIVIEYLLNGKTE
jgi:hypothetical protein